MNINHTQKGPNWALFLEKIIFYAFFRITAWEQRRFGDLAEINRGLTFKPTDIRTTGIRVLRSSNINEDVFLLRTDDIFVDNNAVNIGEAKDGDILITSANGSNRLVGKHAIIANLVERTVHGGFMLLARTDYPNFTNSLMSSIWYRKFLHINVSGGNGAIGNLKMSDLSSQIVLVPNENEIKFIGEIFKKLDNLITLHQRMHFDEIKEKRNVSKY